jgi:hypothetical protein
MKGENMKTNILQKIREAESTRITPIPGSKKVNLQIKTKSGWATILTTDQSIAEDTIRQATSRVICG